MQGEYKESFFDDNREQFVTASNNAVRFVYSGYFDLARIALDKAIKAFEVCEEHAKRNFTPQKAVVTVSQMDKRLKELTEFIEQKEKENK